MPDKLSVLAIREVGSPEGVSDKTAEKWLDKFTPSIAKEAARRERVAILLKLGAQSLDEAAQVPILRAERDARPTASEERKHVRGAFGWGMFSGLIIGLILMSVVTVTVVARMNEQTRASTEAGVMIGVAAEQQGVQPVLTEPEPYDQGRREPPDAPQ